METKRYKVVGYVDISTAELADTESGDPYEALAECVRMNLEDVEITEET